MVTFYGATRFSWLEPASRNLEEQVFCTGFPVWSLINSHHWTCPSNSSKQEDLASAGAGGTGRGEEGSIGLWDEMENIQNLVSLLTPEYHSLRFKFLMPKATCLVQQPCAISWSRDSASRWWTGPITSLLLLSSLPSPRQGSPSPHVFALCHSFSCCNKVTG